MVDQYLRKAQTLENWIYENLRLISKNEKLTFIAGFTEKRSEFKFKKNILLNHWDIYDGIEDTW